MTQTIDFSALATGTSFDAIPALTLRFGPTGRFSVRADKAIAVGGGAEAMYTLPVGGEALETWTFNGNGFYAHSGMIFRAGFGGGTLSGYKVAHFSTSGGISQYSIQRFDNSVAAVFGPYWGAPDATLPVTFECQNIAGNVVIRMRQNGVIVNNSSGVADWTDSSPGRYLLPVYYGIYADNNPEDPIFLGTSVATGFVAGQQPPIDPINNRNFTCQVGDTININFGVLDPVAPPDIVYTLLSGTLPAGTSLSSTTGVLSGTATAKSAAYPGNTFTIRATDPITTKFVDDVMSLYVVETPRYKPLVYSIGQFNVPVENMAAVKARGIVDTILYQKADFNGQRGAADGDYFLAGIRANGFKCVVQPGYYVTGGFFPPIAQGDDTSNLLALLDNPDVVRLTLDDEPGTPDRAPNPPAVFNGSNGVARRTPQQQRDIVNTWRSMAAAASPPRTMKSVEINLVANSMLYGLDEHRDQLDVDEIDVFSTDFYPTQFAYPRLYGRNDYQQTFTSTEPGAVQLAITAGQYTTVDGYTAQTAARFKPYGTYILGCRSSPTVAAETPAGVAPICWSSITFGGFELILFNFTFTTAGALALYDGTDADPSLVPFLQEFKRRIAVLHSLGVLFRSAGGRTPYSYRLSAVATGVGGALPGPRDDTGVIQWKPALAGQFQGGFEGVELFTTDSSASVRLVYNLTIETKVLNDTAWGIVNQTFAPGEARAFRPSSPTVNIFDSGVVVVVPPPPPPPPPPPAPPSPVPLPPPLPTVPVVVVTPATPTVEIGQRGVRYSPVDIANMALAELPADPISSMTEKSLQARECNRWYKIIVAEMLSAHAWSWAKVRAKLAVTVNDRPGEWRFAYALPSASVYPLRMVPEQLGSVGYQPLSGQMIATPLLPGSLQPGYVVAGTKLYSNDAGGILEFTTDVGMEPLFTPAFARALALELAQRICPAITKSRDKQGDLIKLAQAARQRAIASDLNQQPRCYSQFLDEAGIARGMALTAVWPWGSNVTYLPPG